MTPAQKAGLVVGKEYIYKDEVGRLAVVVFSHDDGSEWPRFTCSKDYDSDGWMYCYVPGVTTIDYPHSMSKQVSPVSFTFTEHTEVAETTTIHILRRLTQAEQDEITKIVEG